MSPESKSVVIATAGHIDHGKTTLVRALTGIDTDRLPEEKRRGITIDLGFASMEMQIPGGELFRLSFVDVPGHSLFVRNMLAGAGCVKAVMLVVAADEGIKPQTIEHLAICELLGFRHGIIVVTKADAADNNRLDAVRQRVRTLLKGTFLDEDDSAIVPVSAKTGAGLAEVRTELLNLAMRAGQDNSDALLRLPLDRAFVMKGFGTVVTGTLLSGTIREGETLTLEPGTKTVRVRGLQTHGEPAAVAHAGSRVAVNLSGIDAAEAHRGQALVVPHTLSGVDTIDAEVTLLPDAPPMKHRARVHFHAFTAETMASVSLFGYGSAQPGGRRVVRLKLAKPMVLAPDDRFVLRQPAPVATIGGGLVLDAHPELKLPKAETIAWLEQLKTADHEQQLILRVQRRKTAGLRFGALSRETGITVDAVRRQLVSAVQRSEILLVPGDLLLSGDAFGLAANRILELLQHVSVRSEGCGLKRSELRSQTGLGAPVFDFVISALARDKKVQVKDESVVAARDHGPSSLAQDERLAGVSQAYEEAGLSPASVPELAQRFRVAHEEMRRIITVLQRQKTIVRMGSDDLFVHVDALGKLRAQMIKLRGSLIDIANFKQLTGLSRKYAIPLLEYLDRERVTRKQGDKRLVL